MKTIWTYIKEGASKKLNCFLNFAIWTTIFKPTAHFEYILLAIPHQFTVLVINCRCKGYDKEVVFFLKHAIEGRGLECHYRFFSFSLCMVVQVTLNKAEYGSHQLKENVRVIFLSETKCKIRFIYVRFNCKRKNATRYGGSTAL